MPDDRELKALERAVRAAQEALNKERGLRSLVVGLKEAAGVIATAEREHATAVKCCEEMTCGTHCPICGRQM